ncbi:MAG: TlyA family RNA methyltransferase [Clostridia bacterium]|nr:TlyA family RNA methyltransferase [Clostridia bacterium]
MPRIDVELVNRGLFSTRSKAMLAIKDGIVYCDKKKVTKGGLEVNSDSIIEIKGEILPYVSRGGLKLAKAIENWNINLSNKIMIDIGSSTGGFCDVALKNDIKKVYAIDVGKDQLDKELRKNEKIELHEQTDFREINNDIIEDATIACIDVSFISVTKLIDKIKSLNNIKEVVCLIKPQFECGKEVADKYKGVIKDENERNKAIEKVTTEFKNIGFKEIGVILSPIKGGDGNIEYLAYFRK